jgi:hypothetical protein
VPAVCERKMAMARRQKPAKIEPVVTSKSASGRPLLVDSALPVEFALTHSKQTTEKFLPDTRTHIRIFNFRPFTTQNPAQLIQRHRFIDPRRSSCGRTSTRFWPKSRSYRKQRLNPFYPGPEPHSAISIFCAFFRKPSPLKVQPYPHSTHRIASGIMPRTCLQDLRPPSALV